MSESLLTYGLQRFKLKVYCFILEGLMSLNEFNIDWSIWEARHGKAFTHPKDRPNLSRESAQMFWDDSHWYLCGAIEPFKGTISESQVQQRLHSYFGGETEVECRCGIADLVTADRLVEIKQADNWKAAVGQAVCYNVWFKKPMVSICLFNLRETFSHYIVLDTCRELKVNLMLYKRNGELLEYRC
jgi:hypothetical protein